MTIMTLVRFLMPQTSKTQELQSQAPKLSNSNQQIARAGAQPVPPPRPAWKPCGAFSLSFPGLQGFGFRA